MLSASFSPKFNVQEIYNDFIGKDWFRFQELIAELGQHTLEYLQTYINAHSHRDGKRIDKIEV